jgi:hypothetical protein
MGTLELTFYFNEDRFDPNGFDEYSVLKESVSIDVEVDE